MVCYPTVDNGYNFPQKMKHWKTLNMTVPSLRKKGKKMENKTTT